jgi:hypothetical protein
MHARTQLPTNRSRSRSRALGAGLALVLGLGCRGQKTMSDDAPDPAAAQKIAFDLGQLNTDGLAGPPDGLRAISYELCVPDRSECLAEVQRIDPSLELMRGARGRIGCETDQVLCLGSTHQPEWRQVLTRLADLPYVTRIAEAHFEH